MAKTERSEDVTVRICVLKTAFFRSPLNYIDITVTFTSVLEVGHVWQILSNLKKLVKKTSPKNPIRFPLIGGLEPSGLAHQSLNVA